jgi:hypothetical protein
MKKTVVTGLRAITVWPVEFASGQLTKLVGQGGFFCHRWETNGN